MKVSIVKQGFCLIACIPALADGELMRLRDTLIEQIGSSHAQALIVDVTALDVMDSFATRTLGDLAAKIRRLGAEMVLVGIQPDVAVAASRLGLKFDSVATVQGLDEGLAYLSQRARAPVERSGALR
jgi:rsbT antagonist protein RsbS